MSSFLAGFAMQNKKAVVSLPKICRKDRAMAVVIAARREAKSELKRLHESDKSERDAARNKK